MKTGFEMIDTSAFDQFIALWGNEAGPVIGEIAGMFLENAPKLLEEMAQALESGNAQELRRLAHTFKSNAATVGARPLAALCQKLEDAAKENRLEDARTLFRQIQEMYPQTRDELTEFLEAFKTPNSE